MQELDALMRDKLETHCRQQLSAMLDGALAPDEARFLLRRLQHDHELAGCWERWQLCGDMLRGSAPALLPNDFSQRVLAAIAEEGEARAVAAGAGRRVRPRWGWAGGAALAASVAVAALWVGQGDPGSATPAAAETAPVLAVSAPAAGGPTVADTTAPRIPSAPERPATPAPDTGATAAAALAVADLPRRAAARRASRPARRAVAPPVTEAPTPVQVAATLDIGGGDSEPASQPAPAQFVAGATSDPFAGQAVAPARPWPRAVLPGLGSGGFTVDYGGQAEASGYDRFEPQLPVEQPSGE